MNMDIIIKEKITNWDIIIKEDIIMGIIIIMVLNYIKEDIKFMLLRILNHPKLLRIQCHFKLKLFLDQ